MTPCTSCMTVILGSGTPSAQSCQYLDALLSVVVLTGSEKGGGVSADHVLDAAVQRVEGGPDRSLPNVFAHAGNSGELLAAAGAEHGQSDKHRAVAAGRRQLHHVELETGLAGEQFLNRTQRRRSDRPLHPALGGGPFGAAEGGLVSDRERHLSR